MAAVLKAVHPSTDSQTEVTLEPHIQELLPWLRNIDKRRISICSGCGLTFIGNKVGQKSCSPTCRNFAWRNETGYEPNRNYNPKGKHPEPYSKEVLGGCLK